MIKRVFSLALSMLMVFALVLPCTAMNITSDDELTVCLTEGYEEKEEYLTSLMTRLMEINIELKEANSNIETNGYSVNADSEIEVLLEEYEKLDDLLCEHQITFDEFEHIVYPSLEEANLMSTDDYELGDVTNAFDMLTDRYKIVTLSGSWARGGVVYDTFCVMVSDTVGGSYLDTYPQNVTLYSKKSQTNTFTNFKNWLFELGTNFVTRKAEWYAESVFSFFNINGGLDISEADHAYQLTVAGTATMRYTYVKPQSQSNWIHANTSQKVIATETHLSHYKVFPEGGQSYYDSEKETIRRYLDGRYYMSDLDAIDNYRSYNNPSALIVTQNNIEATYEGKDGILTISFTYFDYPFQLS